MALTVGTAGQSSCSSVGRLTVSSSYKRLAASSARLLPAVTSQVSFMPCTSSPIQKDVVLQTTLCVVVSQLRNVMRTTVLPGASSVRPSAVTFASAYDSFRMPERQ